MTKILFTVTTDLNNDQRMQRICSALHEEGFDVNIIGRQQKYSDALLPAPYQQKRINCIFQKGKFFYLEYNIRLFFYLLFQKADVICGIDLDTILPAYFVSKLRNKKCVYDAHEYFTELPTVVNRIFEKKIWTLVEQFIIPRVDELYTVSESIANEFDRLYKVDCTVIRNLPLYSYPDNNMNEERFMIYQGAVKEGRALYHLLDCMKNVSIPLKIVGNGNLVDELKEYSAEIGVNDRVSFLGNLPVNELKKITRKAWIGINPLENIGKSYYYSLSNKFFDYMQAGIPQISIDFPEYKAINNKFCIAEMITSFNSIEFEVALNNMEEHKHYNRLKSNTKAASTELNWEKEKEILKFFYRAL